MPTARRAAKPVTKRTSANAQKQRTQTKAVEVKKAATRRSQKIADQYAAGDRKPPPEEAPELPDDATPLDVMVMAMRRAFMIGGSIHAAQYAEKAAPYMHGKISTVELKNTVRTGGSGETGPVPFVVQFVDSDGDGHPKE